MLVIHGGAGTLFKGKLSEDKEIANQAALQSALEAGYKAYAQGKSAMGMVCAAIEVLENFEGFNAGKGSVFTHEGQHQMDASLMDGHTLEAGAVAGIRGVKNPILLAQKVLKHSDHVMLLGQGAEQFAREHELAFEPPEYFFTDYRYQQLQALKDSTQTALDHSEQSSEQDPEQSFGTVGAVALDMRGNLAAGTSTGGMTNKRYHRVGDSPIIGAGTYADNRYGAVSCTGHGEYFMRSVAAYDLIAAMRYGKCSLEEAGQQVMAHLSELGGGGGLIALNRKGELIMPFNTTRMYRGWVDAAGQIEVEIY